MCTLQIDNTGEYHFPWHFFYLVYVVNCVQSCPLFSWFQVKQILLIFILQPPRNNPPEFDNLLILNEQMWRLTPDDRCVTGLAHHVTWGAPTSDHVTSKAPNATCQICKASTYEGTAMLVWLCARKFCWKNDKRGVSHMIIKTSVFRMTHAREGVIACPSWRNDVTGPSGKPEEDRRQHYQCQRLSSDLIPDRSTFTLVFWKTRISGYLWIVVGLDTRMSAFLKLLGAGGKGGKSPTPQDAIQRLRETEEMLTKKQEFLEKKIEQELMTAKKNGTKNKRGNGKAPNVPVCVGQPSMLFRRERTWLMSLIYGQTHILICTHTHTCKHSR